IMSSPYMPFSPFFATQTEEPTMDSAIKELDTEGLIQFLKKKNLELKDSSYEILKKQEIPESVFSNFTEDEFRSMGKDFKDVLKEFRIVGTSIGDIPQFTPDQVAHSGNLLADDNERERCEYVESILDSAIHIVKRITRKQVTRYPQMEVTREDNIGFMQNLLQLQSVSQINKCIIGNVFREKDYIYGIVTIAEVWYFLKYTNEGIACTSKNPLKVEFNESALEILNEERNLRNNLKRIIEIITGLLIDKLGDTEPPVKKQSNKENTNLKAEVAKLRCDILEIKLQTRVNTDEHVASHIEVISQSDKKKDINSDLLSEPDFSKTKISELQQDNSTKNENRNPSCSQNIMTEYQPSDPGTHPHMNENSYDSISLANITTNDSIQKDSQIEMQKFIQELSLEFVLESIEVINRNRKQ
ncbi:4417_t:CDS:2, partial [Dentiscutata heterogama]